MEKGSVSALPFYFEGKDMTAKTKERIVQMFAAQKIYRTEVDRRKIKRSVDKRNKLMTRQRKNQEKQYA